MAVRKLSLASYKVICSSDQAVSLWPTGSRYTHFLRIRAKDSNTGKVYWGDANVDNDTNDWLDPGDGVQFDGSQATGANHLGYNLADIYIRGQGIDIQEVIVTYQHYTNSG